MSGTIAKLIDGFHAFRSNYFSDDNDLFKRLALLGQSPKVLVVACSDSRVDPAILTGAEPGDLFVIRNVGNLIPPYDAGGTYRGTRAALEFSVCGLEVEHIVLLGHSRCGGIGSLINKPASDAEAGGFMRSWMRVASEACRPHAPAGHDAEDAARAMEKAALLISLGNLKLFPWVAERIERGALTLHAWYFDLEKGALLSWDAECGDFVALVG